jgi:antitoxin component of MazEF toxin-antitoxin module
MSDVRRATIRERRQITLPADFCKELGLEVGDVVTMDLNDGTLILTPGRKRALDALAELHRIFAESGVTEEDLQEEGRRIRAELSRQRYGQRKRTA